MHIKTEKVLKITALFCLLGYYSTGFFPFATVECDGSLIAAGAQYAALHPNMATSYNVINVFNYRRRFFNGTYILLTYLSRLLGLNSFFLFSWLTIISFIISLVFISIFISKMLDLSFLITFPSILILFQEFQVTIQIPTCCHSHV